jgi:hypothetical protein
MDGRVEPGHDEETMAPRAINQSRCRDAKRASHRTYAVSGPEAMV